MILSLATDVDNTEFRSKLFSYGMAKVPENESLLHFNLCHM